MFRLLERYQTVIVIFAVVALPLLVYRANASEPANANFLDKLVLAASMPIQRALTWAVGTVSDTWSTYVAVAGAREENAGLRLRLMAAERKKDELAGLAVENERLRGLVAIKEMNPKVVTIEANVIAAGTSPLGRTIDIDRGSVDHVTRGMVVIADAGLVGLVMRVGWTSAEVLLIADEKVKLSATVTRSRARGRLKGAGLQPGYALELGDVLRSEDVQEGDRVATSGLGGVFPKGLPIGEISAVRTATGGQHLVCDVEPYVEFAKLETVMVLLEVPKDEPIVTPQPLRPAALRTGTPPGLRERRPDGGAGDAAPRDAGPRVRGDAGPRAGRDGGVAGDAAAGGEDDAGAIEDAAVVVVPDSGVVTSTRSE